jgi:two-component system response regulator EvgA
MTPIRVLLADGHPRRSPGTPPGAPGVEVVAETADGQEALRLAEDPRPDVVLLDVGVPGLNGLEVAARRAASDASIRVTIL